MLGGAAAEYNKEVERKRQQAADILLAQQKYLMETGLQKFQAIKKSEIQTLSTEQKRSLKEHLRQEMTQ